MEKGIGALETILLDKASYLAFTSGDGACLGCSEKTTIHLFVATVEALMQPRVARRVEKLGRLIGNLERHVQMRLIGDLDIGNPEAMAKIVGEMSGEDVTLASLVSRMEGLRQGQPIDQD